MPHLKGPAHPKGTVEGPKDVFVMSPLNPPLLVQWLTKLLV